MSELSTTSDVIEALGGTKAVAALTGSKYSAVWNWHSSQAFPARTYLAMQDALRERGKEAPAALWGMVQQGAA